MPKRGVFYNVNWESRLLISARTNSSEINDRTYRLSAIGNWACRICTSLLEVNETTLEYLMTECTAYEQYSDWWIQKY